MLPQFEERIVIADATSEKEAEKIILAEFKEYATDNVEFLNTYEINEVDEESDSIVTEVASTMRLFTGTDDEYFNVYWNDLKPKSCSDYNRNHAWYNQGAGKSACYNCREVVEGELWGKA